MSTKKHDTLNGYSLIKQIGEGGMGQVWLAKHEKTRQFFAAKFLSPLLARDKDRERFKREIEILKSLDHPSVAKIYDVIDTKDFFGYIMELCPDGDLDDFINKHPDADLVPFIEQLADAVRYLHAHKFIHRDIKPTNLLIAQDGVLRLSDFGLAVSSDPGRKVLTSSNWSSAGFTAPEQYIDMASVSHKADLFSVGAVLYYLLKRKTFIFTDDIETQLADLNPIYRRMLRGLLQRDAPVRASDFADFLSGIAALKERGVSEYFDVSPAKRLEMLNVRYHICTNSPHTVDHLNDGEIMSFVPFLETIQRYEDDAAVKARIVELHAELSAAIKYIIEDMKQANPD